MELSIAPTAGAPKSDTLCDWGTEYRKSRGESFEGEMAEEPRVLAAVTD